ncbi:hypothetical protein F1721_05190 [Saccharopolyspora hirsuta]|uniref:Uncharacterized protein n=1 Tax=Saccharopolyspora hirsuta TaxID=1837 RepID=A0A5M7CAH5_SACHI|nr:hypothetical protein [Saccharopolyspora hirsuta]KAA5837198.1 hypothetical protein F1721_05190 [Saccharopolyspora hirsuta]
MAELADFCTSPAFAGSYAWWRADAWSGKSALLATFVLAPPPGVRVVSFFITAGWARQSDRQAFADNILEQLWELLGEPPEQHLTEATRETHMLGLLEKAAQLCQNRGEILVLVVDGLDEDRGWDGSPEAHSIAALLPASPPASMRVIVSGRPNPPIPDDVPSHHPLHDPSIVRQLAPSAEAQAVRGAMERDLKRLLYGSAAEQDLLGFLTAAGGGLTTQDLEELIGVSTWQVEEYLRTAAGRSFRSVTERPGRSLDVHLLAHAQLQVAAEQMLGARIGNYQERLHNWADRYAARHWPSDTPEYLLRGYFSRLTAAGDLARMVACATSPHRHHLARARSGGDGAALTEIITTQNTILTHDKPDLVALARLAVHRVNLQRSNSQIPPGLPAGWARLGQLDRAESMIEAFRDPVDRIDALLAAAKVCRKEGETQRAQRMLDQAAELAKTFNQFWGARPVRSVAIEFARIGDFDRARHITEIIRDPAERAQALAQIASQSADTNDHDQAAALLIQAEDLMASERNGREASSLAAMAVASAKTSRLKRSKILLAEAEDLIQSETMLIHAGTVAQAAAIVGDYDRALRITTLFKDPNRREDLLISIISIISRNSADRAESIARQTSEPIQLCRRLAAVAENTTDHDHANRLIAESEDSTQEITDQSVRNDVLIDVAVAAAIAGSLDHAIAMAYDYAKTGTNAEPVFFIAAAALRANDLEHGAELLELAESIARKIISADDQRRSLLWIKTVADFQDFDRAEALARSLQDSSARSAAWAVIAEGALAAEDLNRAETALAAVDQAPLQRRARLDLIRGVLSAGNIGRAVAIARKADVLTHRAAALTLIAQETRDNDLLDEVEQIIESIPAGMDRMKILLTLVESTAKLHLRKRTMRLIGHLRKAAQAVIDSPDDSQSDTRKAQKVAKLCSTRPRTLTEIAETASYLQNDHFFWSNQDILGKIVPAQQFSIKGINPSKNKNLTYQLSQNDWHYVVEELTEAHPDAYHAITFELDQLANFREI